MGTKKGNGGEVPKEIAGILRIEGNHNWLMIFITLSLYLLTMIWLRDKFQKKEQLNFV